MTRDEVRFLLARYGAAYRRGAPSAAVLDEWDRALRPYPAIDAHAVLDHHIDTGAKAPNLATFTAHVRARQAPRPLPDPPPESLWSGPSQRGRDLIAKARSVLRHPSTQDQEPA